MGAIGGLGGQPVHESILEGIMSELGVVPHMHLLQDPGAVRIDGADTHGQIIRDLFQALTDSNQAHHLILAIRELFMERFFQGALQICGQ